VNGWILAAAVLLGAGVGATVWGVATGPLRRRVVAQNLCTAFACPALLLLSQGYDRPSYVDLALVLALLGPVGTLVFARLLADELSEDPPSAWGRPETGSGYETTGSGERPETRHRLRRIPDTMTAVPAVLLAGALTVGVAPGFAKVVARSVNETGSAGVFTSVHWTPAGVLLGLVSTLLAGVLALLAVARPKAFAAPDRALWLRRLQSGHIGDYVAWVLVGTTVLGALTLPGMLGG